MKTKPVLSLVLLTFCTLALPGARLAAVEVRLAKLAPPTNIRVEAGRNAIKVIWEASADEANFNLAGYNVYFDENSLASSSPNQLAAAIQVGKGNHECLVRGLKNGRQYFFHVRSRNHAGEVGAPSLPENEATPEVEAKQYVLAMYDDGRSTSGYNSGYGWNNKNGQALPGFHDVRQHGKYVDLLMVASPTKKQSSIFVSPAETEHTQKWPIRNKTLIADLGADGRPAEALPDSAFTTQAEIKQGHTYILKTETGYHIKLRVESITEVNLLLPLGESRRSALLNKIAFNYVAQLGQSYEQFLTGSP